MSSPGFSTMSKPAEHVYTPRDDLDWSQVGTKVEFNSCLASPRLRSLFAEHLRTEYSLENLMFLEKCILFFEAPTREKLTDLLTDFVGGQAPHEINLSNELIMAFKNVGGDLAEAQNLIVRAQAEVYGVVSADTFARFIKTAQYIKAKSE